jgi:hypothetical protein
LASYAAVNILKTYQVEHPEIPADEQIVGATLTNLSLYGGLAAFDVTLKTVAGDTLDFLVPLPK